MVDRREKLLILEDTPARIAGFKQAIQASLHDIQPMIADTASYFKSLVTEHLSETFAISLDHDLHPPGVVDAGDGMQIAQWLSDLKPACPIIIHTSNGEQGRRMHGVLEASRCDIRLAGAIGEDWIDRDWIVEITAAYRQANPSN